MGNKTTTDAIRGGRLSIMIDSLQQESTIPHDKWYAILANRHCSIALLDDTFKDMILELQQAGIPPQHYYNILQQNTASNMIHSDKPVFQRVIGALRVSGVDVGDVGQGASPPPRHHCNFKRLSPKNDSQPQPRWM